MNSSILQVRNAGFFIFDADNEKSSLSSFSCLIGCWI